MLNYLASLIVFFVLVAAVIIFILCAFIILDSLVIWWCDRHGR